MDEDISLNSAAPDSACKVILYYSDFPINAHTIFTLCTIV